MGVRETRLEGKPSHSGLAVVLNEAGELAPLRLAGAHDAAALGLQDRRLAFHLHGHD